MAARYVPPRRRSDPPRTSESNAELSQNWRQRSFPPSCPASKQWRTETPAQASTTPTQRQWRLKSKSDPPLPTNFGDSKLSREQLLAARKTMPGTTPLAVATEAYKQAEFDFRFWLFNQASELPGIPRLHHLASLDYEGHISQNLTPIREIVNEMYRTGRKFPDHSVAMLTKVIDLREIAQQKFHAGEEDTEAYQNHEHWVNELKSIRETMQGKGIARRKSLEEIEKCTDWRQH